MFLAKDGSCSVLPDLDEMCPVIGASKSWISQNPSTGLAAAHADRVVWGCQSAVRWGLHTSSYLVSRAQITAFGRAIGVGAMFSGWLLRVESGVKEDFQLVWIAYLTSMTIGDRLDR